MTQKSYHLDTSVLLEAENTIDILRNGEENEINISMTVINELDSLLKNKNKREIALKAFDNIWKNKEYINFTGDKDELHNNDDCILWDAKDYTDKPGTEKVFITNDKILQLKAYILEVAVADFKISIPFQTESQKYTGFVDVDDEKFNNCFYFKDGKLFGQFDDEEKCINYENEIWKIKPKDVYQNAAMELMLNDKINLVTVQAKAGVGKSYLSLATGLYKTLEKKKYKKMIVIKSNLEIGESLGFLPGPIAEKMEPYWIALYKLLLKLHYKRPCDKVWIDCESVVPVLNPRFVEFLPMNYVRGMNIDNAFVVIDEAQNITRADMRTILSRMGENVKCVCIGDITQIDNNNCNQSNNGLNWIIKKMKGYDNYAHLTMNCKTTRGPICDLVVNSGL